MADQFKHEASSRYGPPLPHCTTPANKQSVVNVLSTNSGHPTIWSRCGQHFSPRVTNVHHPDRSAVPKVAPTNPEYAPFFPPPTFSLVQPKILQGLKATWHMDRPGRARGLRCSVPSFSRAETEGSAQIRAKAMILTVRSPFVCLLSRSVPFTSPPSHLAPFCSPPPPVQYCILFCSISPHHIIRHFYSSLRTSIPFRDIIFHSIL